MGFTMKQDNRYTFRDLEGFLDELDQGIRSQFIREAIESKLHSNTSTYQEEVEETGKLIEFYENTIKTYDEEIALLQQNKKRTTTKLEKLTIEQERKKKIVGKQEKIEDYEKLRQIRQKILTQITITLLEQDKHTPNMNYLKTLGQYKRLKELRNEVITYVDTLNEYDTIQGKKIFKKDLEYIKQQVRREDLWNST